MPAVVRRGIVPRRSAISPSVVVVLRGSRPANSNMWSPPMGVNGEGYGSTANGPPEIGPTPYTAGLGNVGGFDFSGLSPPAGVFILGR